MPNEKFINFYKHEDCDGANVGDVEYPSFTSRSDHVTNDKCPECGCELEPYDTRDNPAYIEPEPESSFTSLGLTRSEHGTVIAALRLWQDREKFFSGGRIEALSDVATDLGTIEPLDNDGIEALIDRMQSNEPADTKIVIEIRKGCIYAVDNVPSGYTVECRDFDVEDTNQDEFDALPRFDGEPAHVSQY